MATPEPSFERATRRRHTALLLVSTVDRRILPSLRFVSRLPDTDVRALHLCFDAGETRRLAHDWMELGLPWLPLHIHDAVTGSLADSGRRAVGQELVGWRTSHRRRWRPPSPSIAPARRRMHIGHRDAQLARLEGIEVSVGPGSAGLLWSGRTRS